MKKLFLFLVLFLQVLAALPQCPNNNVLVNSQSIASLSCPTTVTKNISGGEYFNVAVIAGTTYTFQTCGLTFFDTEITLYNGPSITSLAYDDDACGVQSLITWTATYSGNVRVLLDIWPCTASPFLMPIKISCCGAVNLPQDCEGGTTICSN